MTKLNRVYILTLCTLMAGVIGTIYAKPWLHANTASSPIANPARNSAIGVQLIATLPRKTMYSTEPIILTIIVKNTNVKSVEFLETQTEDDFALVVTNRKGEQVPETLYGRSMISPNGSHSSTRALLRNLAAGQKATYKIPVNALYDMSLPDTYHITVKQKFPDFTSGNEIVSNTVSIQNLGVK